VQGKHVEAGEVARKKEDPVNFEQFVAELAGLVVFAGGVSLHSTSIATFYLGGRLYRA
jgi:hypothetical protein